MTNFNKLTVEKMKDKHQVQEKNILKIYGRLLQYARKHWYLLLIGLIGTGLGSGVDASIVWSLKPIVDKGVVGKDIHFLNLLPLFVIIAFFLRGTMDFVSGYFIELVGRNVVMTLRRQLFSHFLKLPAKFFDNVSSGQLISTIIFNIEQVSQASSDSLLIIIRDSCLILFLLIVMFVASWKLTLIFFAVAPVIAFIASYSSKRMRKFSRHLQEGMGDLTHIAEEAITGYRVVRTFGGEAYENNKFYQATRKNRRREMQIIATDALASPLVQMMVSIVIAFTIFIAMKMAGDVTFGDYASILASMIAILKPLKNITTVNNIIQRGVAGAESIFDLLDEPQEKDQGTIAMERCSGAVKLEALNFQYETAVSEDKPILKNINLDVKPGQCIALVGKSGSGKSTLVSLLLRFYDHYQGRITIDGVEIRDIKLPDLRKQFSLVSQHVVLFNDTIGKNIAYGRHDEVSQDDIIEAARAANALEFIEPLKEGFDTLIGENGLRLSGGQRQRLAIARAILRDAPILVLDEATSSLDSESERYIQGALAHLMKKRTSFIIAHRLSTIENADQIVVLKNGEIVEIGTHPELLAKGGEYARLHHSQFRELKNDELETVDGAAIDTANVIA